MAPLIQKTKKKNYYYKGLTFKWQVSKFEPIGLLVYKLQLF